MPPPHSRSRPRSRVSARRAARRCAFLAPTRAPILPRFDAGAGRSEPDELMHQAREGLKARLQAVTPAAPEEDYWTRLEWEVGIPGKAGVRFLQT